jgi:hypothetical protein
MQGKVMSVINGNLNRIIQTVLGAVLVTAILGGVSMNTRLSLAENNIDEHRNLVYHEGIDRVQEKLETKLEDVQADVLSIKLLLERIAVQQEVAAAQRKKLLNQKP